MHAHASTHEHKNTDGFGGVAIDVLTGEEPWAGKDDMPIMMALLQKQKPPQLAEIKNADVRSFLFARV